MIDKSEYVSRVKKAFAKITPAWKPPYKIAIQVAKKMKYDIQINRKPADYWMKNIDRIFDDFENFNGDLDIVLKKGDSTEKLTLRWTDPRKVKEL